MGLRSKNESCWKCVPGGQGVRRGCVWSFESCSKAQTKPHTACVGTGGWRLQEDEHHETKIDVSIMESIVPFSSGTTRMAVGARA